MNSIFKLLLTFGFLQGTVCANTLFPTEIILWEGKTIGYTTDDPRVEFIRPSRWELAADKSFLEQKDEDFFLNLILQPNYDDSVAYINSQEDSSERKTFLPLAMQIGEAELFLDNIMGEVKSSVVPNPINQSSYIYYKLEMNKDQLELLNKLAAGGLALSGSVSYRYQTIDSIETSTAAITIELSQQHLSTRTKPSSFGLEWLVSLFEQYELRIERELDSRVSLGALSVHIEQSILEMEILTEKTIFSRDGLFARLLPEGRNAKGRLIFYVPEIDQWLKFDLGFIVLAKIDLRSIKVSIDHLEAVSIDGPTGRSNEFMTAMINKYLEIPLTKRKLNRAITTRLQRRILSGDLFLR